MRFGLEKMVLDDLLFFMQRLKFIEEPHPQSTLKQDVRLIKLSLVEKVEKLQGSRAVEAVPALSGDVVRRRLQEGLDKAAKVEQRTGKGVSDQAQRLFNALDKTYSLRWDGPNIVSELGIVIKPPYTADSCTGKDAAALSRFKKIVESINQRSR